MTVTFFGHRDTPEEIEEKLLSVLTDLIETKNADRFLIGNHGKFDHIAKRALKKLKKQYPHISCYTVLAYLPEKAPYATPDEEIDTLYPEGLETTPRRFAICKRNEWMVNEADIAVTYVKYSYGGAARSKELAQKKKKRIFELAE